MIFVRLLAVASALLAIPLALINWIDVGGGVYISGRTSDVIISGGDGYLIAALAAVVLGARFMRTILPRLDATFPWVCMACGLGISLVSGRVLFEDWPGDRMWTLFTLFVLGTVIALCGAVLTGYRGGARPIDDEAGGDGQANG